MRLLDTVTGQFVEKNPRELTTRYAILSHTWYPEGEQTYQELRDIQKRYAAQCQHVQGASQHPTSVAPPDQAHPASHSQLSVDPPLATSVASAFELSTSSASNQFEPPVSSIWQDPHLSLKIRGACEVARAKGYRYIWIDSCCIDKTSSSELSESINSMFQWYARADICYAFLVDVPAAEDHAAQGSHFRRSYLFTRGWTLQELIAPARVVFLSSDWTVIGSKHRLASLIAEITHIRYNALLRVEPLNAFSVAERLSWASTRFTTRVEDRAYSLLGLFDIAMPTLYGEGERAFLRLQEEIMRRIPDQSLFAWTSPYFNLDKSLRRLSHLHTVGPSRTPSQSRHLISCKHYSGSYNPSLLADSFRAFSVGWNIDAISHDEISRRLRPYLPRLPAADYSFTPHGIRTQLPLIPLSAYLPAESGIAYPDDAEWYLAILGCEHKEFSGQLLGRVCYIPPSASDVEFLYCGYVSIPGAAWTSGEVHSFDLLPLSPEIIAGLRLPQVPPVVLKTVYVSHTLHRDDGALDIARRQPHETIILALPRKTRDALSAQGYTTELRSPDPDHPATHSLTLSCDEHVIAIQFQHTLEHDGRRLTVTAEVSVSEPGPLPHAAPSSASAECESYSAYSATLSWTDSLVSPWNLNLTNGDNEVILSTPGAEEFVVVLKLRFATTDHYLLGVEILEAAES